MSGEDNAARAAGRWLLDLLFPPKCAICGRLLRKGERGTCVACLPELPINTADVPCDPTFDVCLAPFRYEEPLRSSILRFKFGGREGCAAAYAGWLAPLVQDRLAGRWELLTWVPISRRRRAERGFDQAEALARELGRLLGVRPVRTLKKIRHTRRQSSLRDASERRANVRNAFRVWKPEQVKGKRILLIDDIVTTGATLAECSGVLGLAGAEQVLCAVLATANFKESE